MPFILPPLPEQRRIVEAIEANFARLDTGVVALTHAKEQARRFRASTWQAAIGGRLVTIPPNSPSRQLLEAVDDLDGHRVPVNASDREGRRGDVPYYGATGQVGWIDDYLFDEELILLGEDGVDFLNPLKPKAYIIRGKSWVNNHAHVLRAKKELIHSAFLEIQLNATRYDGLVNGTTRLKLTKSAMRGVNIIVPSLEVQSHILEEVERCLSIEAEVSQVVSTQGTRQIALREGILRTAFEGLLVPQDPSDEPASALLERIKHERSSSSQSMAQKRKAVRAS
jgi:type I restriction enzyme S subunit